MDEYYGGCDNCNHLMKIDEEYIKLTIPNIGKTFTLQFCNEKCVEEVKINYDYLQNYNNIEKTKIKYVNMYAVSINIHKTIQLFPEYFINFINNVPMYTNRPSLIKLILNVLLKEEMELSDREMDFIDFCKENELIID